MRKTSIFYVKNMVIKVCVIYCRLSNMLKICYVLSIFFFIITPRRDSLHSVDKNHKSCYKIDNNVSERDQKAVTENFKIK